MTDTDNKQGKISVRLKPPEAAEYITWLESEVKRLEALNTRQGGVWISRGQAMECFECLNEIYQEHRDPNSCNYNECDDAKCGWCDMAAPIMQALQEGE